MPCSAPGTISMIVFRSASRVLRFGSRANCALYYAATGSDGPRLSGAAVDFDPPKALVDYSAAFWSGIPRR
jgi:hypothetical protein